MKFYHIAFHFFIEPLAAMICQNLNIKGISIVNMVNKINLYADDILLAIGDSEVTLNT